MLLGALNGASVSQGLKWKRHGCGYLGSGYRHAREANMDNLIIEGDCLPLIQKLLKRDIHDNFVGILVQTILVAAESLVLFLGCL